MPDAEQPGPGGAQVKDHEAAYWKTDGSNWDKAKAEQFASDYWGPPAAIPQFEPDLVPQTIENAEQAAAVDTAGADIIASREDPNQNPAGSDAGLIYPSHVPPNSAEIGYGKWGAPAPFIPTDLNLRDQRIVIAIAERLVADQRPLLVQIKVAENAHLETWPFPINTIIGSSGQVPIQIGTRHANAAGYQIIASSSGLYVGTDQSVGQGNMGVPIPALGANWLSIPANCNLFVSSAGVALTEVVAIYVMQLFMGSTTLAGAEVGGG